MDVDDTVLTSGEVALLFRVTTVTVIRWAEANHLPYFLTPGGQRRFYARHVNALRALRNKTAA